MLFGHQNDDTNQSAPTSNDGAAQPSSAPGVNPLAVDPDTGVSLPTTVDDLVSGPESDTTPVLNQPQASFAPEPATPATTLEGEASETTSSAPEPAPISPSEDILQPTTDDDLLGLKQQALAQLSPLVDHLDQSPEEKFRTTMMLIQSSDNQALIKDAYAAAQEISDDKARAQALLDIVNEINYFTQQNK